MVIGIVSDTHGYLDPQLLEILKQVQCIIHAGDVGSEQVLGILGAIAPVLAVRGNVDRDGALRDLPERLDLVLGGVPIHVVHRLDDARPGSDTGVLIYGHSHRPLQEWRDNILYLNPGAAGRQGFHSERTVMLFDLAGRPSGSLIKLGPKAAGRVSESRRVH